MYDGDKAIITMFHSYLEGQESASGEYGCTVIEYEKERERLHLLLETGKITDISLDGMYECRIQTMQGESVCTGMVKERYLNRAGMILVFQIVNGFYDKM